MINIKHSFDNNILSELLNKDRNLYDIYKNIISIYKANSYSFKYHNHNHINDGLVLLNLAFKNNVPHHVLLAWLFHDIVYSSTIHNGFSEKSSQEFMIDFLKNNHESYYYNSKDNIEKASKYILSTINHEVPKEFKDDEFLKIFLDVDMSYLGLDYSDFLENRNLIRDEYSIYSDEVFYKNTFLFFEKLLIRENIYSSYFGRERFEKRARENLVRHILELKTETNFLIEKL